MPDLRSKLAIAPKVTVMLSRLTGSVEELIIFGVENGGMARKLAGLFVVL